MSGQLYPPLRWSPACRCSCKDLDACLENGHIPVAVSSGLVSQHKCGRDIRALRKWHEVRHKIRIV